MCLPLRLGLGTIMAVHLISQKSLRPKGGYHMDLSQVTHRMPKVIYLRPLQTEEKVRNRFSSHFQS